MGYLIAVIAAVFLLSVVLILFAGGRGRTLDTKEEQQAESHGLGPEKPQDEGATLPQARERLQESEPETRS